VGELKELKFPEFKFSDFKIPQAVAYVLLISALASGQTAGSSSRAASQDSKQQVETLLREFLANVSDPAMHERYWADDVMYTGANGKFRTKAEIVKNVREGGLQKPGDPQSTYEAQDITTHVFGDTAVVAFRLVHHTGDKTENYRNTGTFLRRDGKWQVVAWQATKIPEEVPATK
jgi:uncharacterized protein YchJ